MTIKLQTFKEFKIRAVEDVNLKGISIGNDGNSITIFVTKEEVMQLKRAVDNCYEFYTETVFEKSNNKI